MQKSSSTLVHGSHRVKILLSEQQIQQGVARLADQITDRYGQGSLTIVGIMTGCLVLLADLIRKLEMPLRVGVIQTSSYRDGTSRGELSINANMMPDIRDRDVLLIDDIFDTGHTLAEVVRQVEAMGPKSVHSAVLLVKSGRQQVGRRPDFVTFEIPDEFVVGYGLDYCDEYRNLPYIAAMDASAAVPPPTDNS